MKSNYRRIGNYIRLVDERNIDNRVKKLLGISISKDFIPSVANTIGTDMENYKIIRKNQFACSTMQVRRDKKMPIALYTNDEEAIISVAYPVFEVENTELILPKYLMMWFCRTEFDREACFYAIGGVRGSIEWEDFCNMQLPVPPIIKQKEIVKEYRVLVDRINLNKRYIQKFEETAQAIYKKWFVDFEFPDENGKPYKSNGGYMEFNGELDIEIPKGWKVGELQEIVTFKNGKTKPISIGTIPVYGGNGIVEYINEFNEENVISIGRVGAYCGSLFRIQGKCWISDNAIAAKSKNNFNMFSYYILSSLNLNERSEGTGQPLITQSLLNQIKIIIPEKDIASSFENIAIKLFEYSDCLTKELNALDRLKDLLLSKLARMEE
jgi:type I restriction enzyme, S subunit